LTPRLKKNLRVYDKQVFTHASRSQTMPKHAKSKTLTFALSKLDKKKLKAKMRRLRAKSRAKLALMRMDKAISEDECDFDFDNSTRPLCSTSEDDSDGPQGDV